MITRGLEGSLGSGVLKICELLGLVLGLVPGQQRGFGFRAYSSGFRIEGLGLKASGLRAESLGLET